ncbi:MAG: large ribosomal subunit protein bL28 [Candidatus Hodgkinia cicadicola]
MIKLRTKPLSGAKSCFSGKRNKRKFKTNLTKVRLWSFVLSRFIALRASVSYIKSLTKFGNLDFYILNSAKLPRPFWTLRNQMLKALNG